MPINPDKYNKKDVVKQMFNQAVDIASAPRSMVTNPGVAAAGLAIGAGKNFTDMVALPLSVAQQAGNYLTGKGPVKPEDDIFRKYEEGAQNLAIDIGTLGNRDKLSDVELQDARKAAAGSEFLGSFIGMHGLAGKTPVTKGGLAGVVGEVATKGNIAKSNIISKASKAVPDVLFKGASKIKEIGKKSNAGEFNHDLASLLNPKTATNIVAAKAPEVMVALSNKYDMPIAKIRDVGDLIQLDYRRSKYHDSKITPESYIDTELSKIPGIKEADPQAIAVLKNELVDSLKEKASSADSIADARSYLSDLVLKREQLQRLEAKLNDPKNPIVNVQEVAQLEELRKQTQFKKGELESHGRNVKKYIEDDYIKKTIDPNETRSLETLQTELAESHQKLYDSIASVDPEAASNFDRISTKTFVGRIGQLGNLFKAEPLFGDFTQINEALPTALIKSAEKLGIDSTTVGKYKKGYSDWYRNPKIRDTIQKTIIEPNRTQFDSIYSELKARKTSKTANLVDNILDEAATMGMSNQIQFRQRLIETVIIPEAYAQVKAFGIPEGTVKFNQAVMNHTKSLIEEAGMIPPEKAKILYTDKTGNVTTRTGGYDRLTHNLTEQSKRGGLFEKELGGATSFMLKWVRGATQAKLKSWNVLNETLDLINNTGVVTDAQKALVTNSIVDLVAGTIIFGGRGLRIPGLVTEWGNLISDKESPDNVATLITGAIASYLKINPEAAKELKDGLFYNMTGLSSARTNNMPLPTLGQGNEIFSSIVTKKFFPLFESITKNLDNLPSYVSSGAFMTDVVSMITSQDTEIASDIGSEGQRYDSKGKPIDIDLEKHPLGHAPGVDFTKNLPSKDSLDLGVDYSQGKRNITVKYDRLSDKEFFKKENIKEYAMKLKEYYKGDPKKIKTALKTAVRNRLVPKGGDTFNDLSTLATTYNSIGSEELIRKDVNIQRLTKEQVIEQAALSGITQKGSYKVLKLLVAAGKFDPHNTEDRKLLKQKINEIKTKMKEVRK